MYVSIAITALFLTAGTLFESGKSLDETRFSSVLDGRWIVSEYINTGGQAFPIPFLGQEQYFWQGYATGPLFQCEAEGLVKIHNTYTQEEFFALPEFYTFLRLRDKLNITGQYVSVYHLACHGNGQSLSPMVVTSQQEGFYLFSAAVLRMEYKD